GVPLKYLSLVILITQNATHILSLRYSRTIPGPPYIISTAVFLAELIKLLTCTIIHIYSTLQHRQSYTVVNSYTVSHFLNDVFGPKSDALKIMIPAMLFSIQTNLQYLAIGLLDAASYQITSQLKIFTTAIFSVILLKSHLSGRKWGALGLLAIGVALVQLPSTSTTSSPSTLKPDTTSKATAESAAKFAGFMLVLVACILSGLSGVYFEKVLKQTKSSLWLRNIQLAFFSSIFLTFQMLSFDYTAISTHGFWIGYNPITWLAICLHASGGIIVALVLKYADNILKGFATSIAFLIVSIVSSVLFDFVVTNTFVVGASCVIFATYLYSMPK
ncbi:solute carrier family 35, member A2-like protein, partial [Paraphysoderma sedebokerense]